MGSLRFGRVESSVLGPMWVAETDAGVAAISRVESPAALLSGLRRRFPGVEPEPADVDAAWVDDGSPPLLDLTGLPPFDARVYAAVGSVRSGETVTYGDVAALIGSPGAARAVGGAMARCPLFPAVPCHRVVRASDGWSGWDGDVTLKRRLIATERRRPDDPARRIRG
jgi:O-6-methylguanine DNA methyltransferase